MCQIASIPTIDIRGECFRKNCDGFFFLLRLKFILKTPLKFELKQTSFKWIDSLGLLTDALEFDRPKYPPIEFKDTFSNYSR